VKNEKGFSLIEVIIATAIISIIGIGLLSALGASSKIALKTNIHETARNMAEAQMEYIQNQPYSTGPDYQLLPDISTIYPDYSIVTDPPMKSLIDLDGNPAGSDIGLHKITVTVEYVGQAVFRLEGHKVNW